MGAWFAICPAVAITVGVTNGKSTWLTGERRASTGGPT